VTFDYTKVSVKSAGTFNNTSAAKLQRRKAGAFATPYGGGITLPAIGDPFMGGYYAGIIDSTRPDTINTNDSFQTGLRYALIVSPKSHEPPAGITWGVASWDITSALTRWNGLAFYEHIINTQTPASTNAFGYLKNLNTATVTSMHGADFNGQPPDDGGSVWYMPSADEANLVFKHFKRSTGTTSSSETTVDFGVIGPGDSLASDPSQTGLTGITQTAFLPFQNTDYSTGGEASTSFLTVTRGATVNDRVYIGTSNGAVNDVSATSTIFVLRPVRRLLL
jgi:hypothetical protein